MRILTIGPDPNSPTDGVIHRGIQVLLKYAFGEFTSEHLLLLDTTVMPTDTFKADGKYDLIIVCGTPWLWDSFQNSVKYQNLLRIFKAHQATPKVFMGAGSCLTLDADYQILRRPEEQRGIRALFGFDNTSTVVRDPLASSLLNDAGVLSSLLLPCPAFFCYGIDAAATPNKRGDYDVLVWTDPLKTISSQYWLQNPEKLARYHKEVVELFTNALRDAQVYCKDESEVEAAVRLGLPRPAILRDVGHTLYVMGNARGVVSGRVHCAVPAKIKADFVRLFALDTRAQTLFAYDDMSHTALPRYAERYKEILTSTVSGRRTTARREP